MPDHGSASGAAAQAARPAFDALLAHLLAAGAKPMPRATVCVASAFTDAAALTGDDAPPIAWTEEDLVLLHWRLLKDVCHLADPGTPLAEKFDTLRWVFTEPHKDARPFSFASCLRVVGCSPLSPLPYCGLVDVETLRDCIRDATRSWLLQTLQRYPAWVREAVIEHPDWVEARLARNPQWINEEVRRIALEGDLFA